MNKKNKTEFVKETEEQKQQRWNKAQKFAKTFAKQAGLLKKAAAERKHNMDRDDVYG